MTTDKDLRERHGGAWEGLTDVEIRTRYPEEHAKWSPPEGEPSATVADRARSAMERIADSLQPGSLAVVVSHGAAIRLGAARLLGLPEDLWGVIGPLANCSWSVRVPPARAVAAGRAQRGDAAGAGAQRRPLTSRVGVYDVRGRPRNRYASSGPRAGHVDDAGAIAQLVERLHGMQEVSGSSPLSSTQVRGPSPGRGGGPSSFRGAL